MIEERIDIIMTSASPPPSPTWDDLVRREPRLGALLAEVLAEPGHSEGYCGNRAWFGRPGGLGFKRRMAQLVGWDAWGADPLLRSEAAYTLAYRLLYDALPPCKVCPCMGLESGGEQ